MAARARISWVLVELAAQKVDACWEPYGWTGINARVRAVRLEAIEPEPMDDLHELDAGDNNPRTRIYVVPVAEPFEHPILPGTVRARLYPEWLEEDWPGCMSLQGGWGTERDLRLVNRAGPPGKTVFTFSFCGQDSGLKTTVYVYEAKVGLFADEGDLQNLQFGHSWGRYTLDAVSKNDLISRWYHSYLQEIGFFPHPDADPYKVNTGSAVPGFILLGMDAWRGYWPTGGREFPIRFASLSLALMQTKDDYFTPPNYNLFDYNCTDYAIELGERVVVHTMDPDGISTPWDFSYWLNSNWP